MSQIRPLIIAPSLLSADFNRLGEDLAAVEAGGADWHHFDVMDGHFVPNLTFGIPVVRAVKSIAKIPVDVHLMISNPDTMAVEYAKAGADSVSFHVEASTHHHRLLQALRAEGTKPGIALNPGTPLGHIESLYPFVDYVLLMSVNPGFGGQSFIEETCSRIKAVRTALDSRGLTAVGIQVDGGINNRTVARVREAGANIFVAGSYVYGAQDRAVAIASLKDN